MEAIKVDENIELDSVNENKVKNETLTTELHFELLKQYAWLSSAVIGAIIILVQLKAVEMGNESLVHHTTEFPVMETA